MPSLFPYVTQVALSPYYHFIAKKIGTDPGGWASEGHNIKVQRKPKRRTKLKQDEHVIHYVVYAHMCVHEICTLTYRSPYY